MRAILTLSSQNHEMAPIFKDYHSRAIQVLPKQYNIRQLHVPWAQSRLDLNTIEHLWTKLNRRVIRQPTAPNSLRELQQTLIQELRSISQAFIQNYVLSMRQRCLQVFGARGGHTRYMYKLDVLYSKVTYDKMSLSCDFYFSSAVIFAIT